VERADVTTWGAAEKCSTGAEGITFSKYALDVMKKQKQNYKILN
jgi:hypothetical protein